MRRARFRLRTLMLAVAAAALALGALAEARRLHNLSLKYQRRAQEHAFSVKLVQQLGSPSGFLAQPAGGAAQRIRERTACCCDRMRAKWERAARYPWLPVAPDPAPPE
jgi:hypothetical protein